MIYVFDICDTLYFSNTTFDFIDFYLKKSGSSFKSFVLGLIRNKYSPLFIVLYLLSKISGKDLPKYFALKLLKGSSTEELENVAKVFYQEYLTERRIFITHEILQEAQSQNFQVILLSSTLDPVARVIAENLHVDFESSELEQKDDFFTGRLKSDITGKKHHLLKENSGSAGYTVVTDNFTDYELVKGATNRYVVIHDKKAESHWEPLNPAFIYPQRLKDF